MAKAARAFQEQRDGNVLRGLPGRLPSSNQDRLPWGQIHESELPPMMFQLRRRDGQMTSFPYGCLVEIHLRDAGYVQLFIAGRKNLTVTLEGRHLRELANLLGQASVTWIEEADPRDIGKPESTPEVTSILIEAAGE